MYATDKHTIQSLLEKRAAVYPVRDESYEALQQALEAFFEKLWQDAFALQATWKPDPQKEQEIKQFIEQPVFICGGMKCGTTLLTQLLDSHPALLVMPGDSDYVQKFLHFQGDVKDLAKHWFARLVNPSGKAPFWFLGEDMEGYRQFCLYLDLYSKQLKDPFQQVVAALHSANLKAGSHPKYWVEKTPGNEVHAQQLLATYPKAKFIHILRDPLTNMASIKKNFGYRKVSFKADRYSRWLKLLVETGYRNQATMGASTYKICRYEDIVRDPLHEMQAIADFLAIEWNATLLQPTENGVPAQSNTMYAKDQVAGAISKAGINNRWQTELTEREKQIITYNLYELALKMGYRHWKEKDITAYNQFMLHNMFFDLRDWLYHRITK